jgi:hypothetical protein
MTKINKMNGWYGTLSDDGLAKELMGMVTRSDRSSVKKFDERLWWTWHPEYVKFKKKKEYQKNKDSYISRASEAYRKNPEEKREYGRNHYAKNPEAYKMRSMDRTSAIGRGGKDSKCLLFYKFCSVLNSIHGKITFHVDHIFPVSKGGESDFGNLQLATASYNLWKRAKTDVSPIDYFGQGAAKP